MASIKLLPDCCCLPPWLGHEKLDGGAYLNADIDRARALHTTKSTAARAARLLKSIYGLKYMGALWEPICAAVWSTWLATKHDTCCFTKLERRTVALLFAAVVDDL
jgi:hypothetical protein